MKNFFLAFGIVFLAALVVSACGGGLRGLEGGAGLEEDGDKGSQSGVDSQPEIDVNGGNQTETQMYSVPTLTITRSENGSTSGPSIAPICQGQYQVVAPKVLLVGEQGVVTLTIASNFAKVKKVKALDDVQVLQSMAEIDLYPQMSANLIFSDAFVVKVERPEQFIRKEVSAIWHWYLTPRKSGMYALSVKISTPIMVNGALDQFPIAAEDFYISVLESAPDSDTPAWTQTPMATATTWTQSVFSGIASSIGEITVALIGAAGAIGAAAVAAHFSRENSLKKERQIKSEEAQQKAKKGILDSNEIVKNKKAAKEKQSNKML